MGMLRVYVYVFLNSHPCRTCQIPNCVAPVTSQSEYLAYSVAVSFFLWLLDPTQQCFELLVVPRDLPLYLEHILTLWSRSFAPAERGM